MQRHPFVWAASSLVALAASCVSAPPSARTILAEMRRSAGDAVVLEVASPEVTNADERATALVRATGGRAIVEPFYAHEVSLYAAGGTRREILQGAGVRALDLLAESVTEGTLAALRVAPSANGPIPVAMSRGLASRLGLAVGSTIALTPSSPLPGCASARTARVDALVAMPGDDVLPESARAIVTSNASARAATCAGPTALRISAIDTRRGDEIVAMLQSRAAADGLRIVPFREL